MLCGISFGIPRVQGNTALMIAAKRGHTEIVLDLLQCGTNRVAKSSEARHALTSSVVCSYLLSVMTTTHVLAIVRLPAGREVLLYCAGPQPQKVVQKHASNVTNCPVEACVL